MTIKQKVFALLAKFHPYFKLTPLVEDVVSDFNKVVAALEEVTKHHLIGAVAHAETIKLATEAKAFAEAEAAKARVISGKVRDLFSV